MAGEAFMAATQVLETAPDAGIALAASEILASTLKADTEAFLLVDNARLKDVDARGAEL